MRLPLRCLAVAGLVFAGVEGCGAELGPPVRDLGLASLQPPPHFDPPPVAEAPGDAGVEAAAPPQRRPGAYANLDPDDDYVLGPPAPLDDCDEQLKTAGVKFVAAKIPVHTEGKLKLTCGAPQVVTYIRGPGKITYEPLPVLTCEMALALASWEKIVNEEAVRTLHSRVARIEQLGTYNCRVIPTAPTFMSEHGYANAIDIGRIFLENGKTISIYSDFDKGEDEPKKPSGQFLRAISRRANDEDVFSHVLTPFFDHAHDNHFHLDLARFRRDGTRPGF
jgi:hypothetical protein